ncbi:MAG: ABC transporter ATP-binding protein [Treponema sp.]|nr:ABC transporter ATP-binding protein [Treponema sp.]
MHIELKEVSKHFGPVKAVDNLSLSIDSGQLVSLLGPSGCGKTTILNVISGILPVTSGTILFDGQDVTKLSPEKRGIGLVFQNYALYPHMTVLENISFPLMVQKMPKKERHARAAEYAELVQVKELLNRKPAQLSGGQQQRVAIARALSKKPGILLLDEPLSNLDAQLRIEMREEIRRLQREMKITTIFVTHDQEESAGISDKIALLQQGITQQYASPRDLYDNPANLFTASFIGAPSINRVPGKYREGVFYAETAQIKLPPQLKAPQDRDLILAFRAESLIVSSNWEETHLGAPLDDVYAAGKDYLALLRIGSALCRIYIPEDQALDKHDVPLRFRNKGVFLFDAETGERYS